MMLEEPVSQNTHKTMDYYDAIKRAVCIHRWTDTQNINSVIV